jgi:hypothetical protein
MLYITQDDQIRIGNVTYAKDLYFPNVGTFIWLNTNLAQNNLRTLKGLAKGLGVPRFSTFAKAALLAELKKYIQFM